MKIKIELNSKELATLVGDSRDPIGYDFEIDIYTESQKTISNKQETAILGGLFWALCTMLPHTIIKQVFLKWNGIVEQLQKGLQEKAAKVTTRVVDKPEE